MSQTEKLHPAIEMANHLAEQGSKVDAQEILGKIQYLRSLGIEVTHFLVKGGQRFKDVNWPLDVRLIDGVPRRDLVYLPDGEFRLEVKI